MVCGVSSWCLSELRYGFASLLFEPLCQQAPVAERTLPAPAEKDDAAAGVPCHDGVEGLQDAVLVGLQQRAVAPRVLGVADEALFVRAQQVSPSGGGLHEGLLGGAALRHGEADAHADHVLCLSVAPVACVYLCHLFLCQGVFSPGTRSGHCTVGVRPRQGRP